MAFQVFRRICLRVSASMLMAMLFGCASRQSQAPNKEKTLNLVGVDQILTNQRAFEGTQVLVTGYLCWFDVELGSYALFADSADCSNRRFGKGIVVLFDKIPRAVGFASGVARVSVTGVYGCGAGLCSSNSIFGNGYIKPQAIQIEVISTRGDPLPRVLLQ